MLKSFEISNKLNEDFSYNFKMSDALTFNYNHENIFNSVKYEGKILISYGYCFDVREPKTEVKDTLTSLLENAEDILESMKYLNGHFVLLFNVDGNWKLMTDAAGITPVYFDKSKMTVSTENTEVLSALNGFTVLNLEEFTITRTEIASNKLTDERIERIILDLVSKQYKYFLDKELTLNFRRNKMNKAVISIMHPALIDQTLNLRENDDITLKLSKWISREYKMDVLPQDTNPSTDYLINTHLMDYNTFINKDIDLSAEEITEFNDLYQLNGDYLQSRTAIEYNLLNNLKYRNEVKPNLIYDPFNVIAIQEVIYDFKESSDFDPLQRIIKILHPAIDFYDFSDGSTLMQKYTKLKKQNKKMSAELKEVKFNQEFLSDAAVNGIIVSDNLDGKLIDKGLTFHPVSSKINKDEIYEVTYTKNESGMILVESYFDNPKNAHRIKIELNDEQFNIDEFLEGKFIQVDKEINIKMYYERDYNAASWQKAGKITIKEID